MTTETVRTIPTAKATPEVSFSFTPTAGAYTYSIGSDTYMPPNAYYAISDTVLTFTGTAVFHDDDEYAISYEWDFGNGMRGYGQTVTHQFSADNAQNQVVLTVVDNLGRRHRARRQVYLRKYEDIVRATLPDHYWPLTERIGTTAHDYVGDEDGTYLSGATLGANGPLSGSDYAVDLDGVNDRIQTTYGTRRNLCTNPSAETTVAGSSLTNAAVEQSPDRAKYGAYSFKVTPNGGGNPALFVGVTGIAASTQYQYGVWVYTSVQRTFFVQLTDNIDQGLAGSSTVVPAATWTFVSATGTTDSHTSRNLGVWATDAAVTPFYIDGFACEQGSLGPYFDGSGYVNDEGDWVDDPGGHVGWLGTAHASASDLGCFANGTARTFAGWMFRDTSSTWDVIIGGPWAINIGGKTGTTQFYLQIGAGVGHLYEWPSGTAPIDEWFHWTVVFDEPANNASLYINGVLVSTQTLAGQWSGPGTVSSGTGSEPLYIGAEFGGSSTVDGRLAHIAAWERALSPADIAILAAIA